MSGEGIPMALQCQDWDDYEEQRAAWLSRLMFGWLHPELRMPAGEPPEPPDDGSRRGILDTTEDS